MIEHNVMTPRPYNRKYQLTGSRGYANKYPVEEFCFAKEVIANEPEFKGVKINEHDAIPEGIQKVLMENTCTLSGKNFRMWLKSRWPRRYGLYYGLPSGILFT